MVTQTIITDVEKFEISSQVFNGYLKCIWSFSNKFDIKILFFTSTNFEQQYTYNWREKDKCELYTYIGCKCIYCLPLM